MHCKGLPCDRRSRVRSLTTPTALRIPADYRALALCGWLLFALSWALPSFFDHSGAAVFLLSVRIAGWLLASGSVAGLAVGVSLLAGWLANFSILIRWPVWARWTWIAIPWLSFAVALSLLKDAGRSLDRKSTRL